MIRCERCGAEMFDQGLFTLQQKWRIHNSLIHPDAKVDRAVIVEVADG
jgi:hypothetical protein